MKNETRARRRSYLVPLGFLVLAAIALVVALVPAGAEPITPQTTNEVEPVMTEQQPEDAIAITTQADEMTSATIRYLEYADYEDPDAIYDEGNRRILGERVLTDLPVGATLHAWDYVLNLPGHFFYDGWPLDLTLSADPSENVLNLIYMKLYNSEYTVNYYLMTGADLEANNWTDALAPDSVEFYKLGSETFDNQRFDALIDGDAYEYMLDGAYVIDTYPAQIRLGTDPDNNVINVLYTPESEYLPDSVEVPAEVVDTPMPPLVDLPGDESMDKDHMVGTLPDSVEIEDFIGSDIDRGELEITDEMLANPVDKDQAQMVIDAYKTGRVEGQALSQTGDDSLTIAIVAIAVALAAGIIAVFMFRKRSDSKA